MVMSGFVGLSAVRAVEGRGYREFDSVKAILSERVSNLELIHNFSRCLGAGIHEQPLQEALAHEGDCTAQISMSLWVNRVKPMIPEPVNVSSPTSMGIVAPTHCAL
jgi:hypothetical protein